MKYYGTKNKKDYGFYEEPFEGAIEITDEYWVELLKEQNNGKRIILFENNVIAADCSNASGLLKKEISNLLPYQSQPEQNPQQMF